MDKPSNVPGSPAINGSETRQNTNGFPGKNVIDTMSAEGSFTNFLAGMKSSGLTESLSDSGSYTVFAATDEAFKKLAPGALEALMKDTAKLKAVLSYHIVPSHLEAKHVQSGDLKTLQGSTFKVETSRDEVRVNGARVTRADSVASNGVIHAIDTLLLPANWQLLAAAA